MYTHKKHTCSKDLFSPVKYVMKDASSQQTNNEDHFTGQFFNMTKSNIQQTKSALIEQSLT